MRSYEIAGYFASCIFAISHYPQIYKSFKSESSEDISATFLLLSLVASSCMFYYGCCFPAYPILFANANNIVCCLILLLLFYHHKTIND